MRDGCKTIFTAICYFPPILRQTAQNSFHRSDATAQLFCWFSSSQRKISKFRYKIVLQPSRFMFKDFKKMTAISLAVIFFIGLDRFLKVFVLSNLSDSQSLLVDVLKFNFKANYYIAFSLPLMGKWLNIIIASIILFLIYYLVWMWRDGKQYTVVCLFAVILGAISNLYDRLKYGFVVDYLDLKYFTVFNLADVVIVSGIFLLLFILNKKEAA